MPNNPLEEKLAEQLHEWYLEACRRPESGFEFNPRAQEPYEALKEEQKFLDRYIAGKVFSLIQDSFIKGEASGLCEEHRKKIEEAFKEGQKVGEEKGREEIIEWAEKRRKKWNNDYIMEREFFQKIAREELDELLALLRPQEEEEPTKK